MVDKLLGWYSKATQDQLNRGLHWYDEAKRQCEILAMYYGIPTNVAAAIVAILSPACQWERNLRDAAQLLSRREKAVVTTYRRNKEKALKLLECGDLSLVSGNKVSAFFANLMGDHTVVTVDRWAAKAVGIDGHKVSTNGALYRRIANAYKEAAQRVGISPAQFQAIVWLVIREHSDGHAISEN